MKINHKVIIGILKTITIAGFFVAISIKLYNVYKYGGTTKPSTTPSDVPSNEVDEEDGEYEGEGDDEVTEAYRNYPTSIKETTRDYK
jgi:hypothetical protein